MLCPNCGSEFATEVYDGQAIEHCFQCGASFFAENGINRIYVDSARRLAAEKKAEVAFKTKLNCPKDNHLLELVHAESVPADCLLYRCAQCAGILTSPNDLIRFKEAQKAKLDFHRLWGMPLGSLRTILILSFVAIFAVLFFGRSLFFNQNSLLKTKADEAIQSVQINRDDDALVISFRTISPFLSQITFIDKTTNQTTSRIISAQPSTFHGLKTRFFTNTDATELAPTLPFEFTLQFSPDDDLYYQITLTDTAGNVIETKESKLSIINAQ